MAYIALTEAVVALPIADLPAYRHEDGYSKPTSAWLLSLQNRWFRCVVTAFPGMALASITRRNRSKVG